MTNKLTVTVDGQEIEVEEGDRFYLKVGIYSFDRVVVIKRQALDVIGYNFDPDGEPRWFTLGKIDFTRPAPDNDGWIRYYGTGQPVDDDVVVDVGVMFGGTTIYYMKEKAATLAWNDVTHYRIVEESDGWIKCDGNGIPVADEAVIEVEVDGKIVRGPAILFRWNGLTRDDIERKESFILKNEAYQGVCMLNPVERYRVIMELGEEMHDHIVDKKKDVDFFIPESLPNLCVTKKEVEAHEDWVSKVLKDKDKSPIIKIELIKEFPQVALRLIDEDN